MKHLLFILFLGLGSIFTNAQSTVFLKGKLLDKENYPVSRAFVRVAGSSKSSHSDIDGNYSVLVPTDTVFVLQVSNYKETFNVSLGPYSAGKVKYKNLYFSSSHNIKTVVVPGTKSPDRPIISIDPKTIVRFVTPGGGIETALKLLANLGTGGGELSSGYNVRGGNFDENLVYINGIEIYRPFLVRSGQQEGLSVINSDLVKGIEFSAGGFQAKYGDKLSSVLDIKYSDPDSFAATVHASFMGANVHVEDRSENRRFTYLLGARYRSNQYLLNSLDVQGDYKPRFVDIQTLLKYRITPELSLSYLTTLTQNKYFVSPQSRQTSFGNVNSALQLNIVFAGNELMQYTTWMNGLSFDYMPSDRLSLSLLSSSYVTREREHFTVEGAYELGELERNSGSDDFATLKSLIGFGYFIDHARNDLNAQVYTVSHKGKYVLPKSTIQWGVGYNNESIVDRLKEWRFNDSSGYNVTTARAGEDNNAIILDEFLKADNNLSSFRVKGFIQNTHLLNPKSGLRTTYGVRCNYWSYNKENVISPRFQISWKPHKSYNDTLISFLRDSLSKDAFDYSVDTLYAFFDQRKKNKWLLRFATGYYYQPPFYRELRGVDGKLNPNLKAQRSFHAVLGGDMFFKAWGRPFKFTGEMYYKHLDRMVPYVVDNVRIRYLAENSSQGYAGGVETRVNGEFIKGVESWFNFSVMQTKERLYYTDDNGDEQLSEWLRRPTDQRVNFSILFQDELPMDPSYKLNLGLVYGAKMPYFFDAANRQKGGFTIPAYRRVDIGFSKVLIDADTEKRPKWLRNTESLWMSLEVFNLLQVNNTISYILIKDFSNTVYGVPNYLTGRRLNLRFVLKI